MKSKTRKILLVLILFVLTGNFAHIFVNFSDFNDVGKNNTVQRMEFNPSNEFAIASDSGDFSLGNLSDIPENVDEQYEYYRNVVLDIFNMTLSDYYSLTGNNTIMFNNHVYALWGLNNGTLSEEEARELTIHNTPKLYFSALGDSFLNLNYPTPDDIIRNDDEEFRMRFKVEPMWGERIRRVHGSLDRDESFFLFLFPWFNALTSSRLTIEELGWKFGHQDGKDWVGNCEYNFWISNSLTLDAVLDPSGFIDPWVEVWIWVYWEFYDMWQGRWIPQTEAVYFCNSVMTDIDFDIIFTPILEPLGIYDDDIEKPSIECYIVDEADLLKNAFDSPIFGFQDDFWLPHRPTIVQNNTEYGYSDGQYLFFGVRDNFPGGTIIVDVQGYAGPIALEPIHYELEAVPMQIWRVLTFLGFKIPIPEDLYGHWGNLTNLQKGIRWEYSVRVKDSDNDRPFDWLFSDKLKFTLYSEASQQSSDDISLSLGGSGQLIQNAKGVLPDNDLKYSNWGTGEDYDVVPYKKNTKASEVKFNLTLHNNLDIPIRIKLNHTQFENDARLLTYLNTEDFSIVKNNEDGRQNYYEGFEDNTPSVIESSFFNTPSEIPYVGGDIGTSTLWVELLPGETRIFEDFIIIKKSALFYKMLDNIFWFTSQVGAFTDITDEFSSMAFDLINLDINTENLGDEYLVDGFTNLFNLIKQYNFVDYITALSHFGIKVEKVYYPSYYFPGTNDISWDAENVIDNRNVLNLMLQLNQESDTVGFEYDENTGFNNFRFVFFPPDEQIMAFNTFVHQIILRDTLLYVSALSSNYFLPDDPLKDQIESCTLTTALGLNSIMYYFMEIMNGMTSQDSNYNFKVIPELMEIPLDLFPELIFENELAERSLSFLETSYEIERNLYGYHASMKRYNVALEQEKWVAASNQLSYASEFSRNAESLMLDLTKDLAFILSEISTAFGNTEANLFSDEHITSLKENFEYDSRYSECLTRQAIFRGDDANDNSWKSTTHYILEHQGNNVIRDIGLNSLNSIPFYSTSKLVFSNIEKICAFELVEIQTEKLSLPIIDDQNTQQSISEITSKIQEAELLFDQWGYQEIVNLMSQTARSALDEYILYRNPEFSFLYFKASRLRDMAQKHNQIEFNMLDSVDKQIINGQSTEFIFQIHNDINYDIHPYTRVLAALTETIGLPAEMEFKIIDFNGIELPKDDVGRYIIQLDKEEYKLLKLKIEVPLNSPYELDTIDFDLKLSQSIPGKLMSYVQSLGIEILEDDITPPEILLSHSDGCTDGNPGIIYLEIIEEDYGSEATGTLTITGPNNFIYTKIFDEGNFELDLNTIQFTELGTYTVILIAENNDEDRGELDEESTETSLEFTLVDDDISAPVISIAHSDGNPTDGNPGILIFDIIELDHGSEATGTLNITGPLDFEFTGLYGEGHFVLDLSQIFVHELGTYEVILHAENNDEDRGENDEESDTVLMNFVISDDDNVSPVIIECIYPLIVFDNAEYIEIQIKAEDFSGIDNVIQFNGIDYLSELIDEYFVIKVPTPQILGSYTGTIKVWDADNDRADDQEYSTYEIEFEVDDDDKDAPVIIFEEISYIEDGNLIQLIFSVSAIDDSGISITEIKIGTMTFYGTGVHEISLSPGIYEMNIHVIDNDNDRPNDQLSTDETYVLIFDLTPPETNLIMLNYYVDEFDTIYVTSGTVFNFSTWDDVSGVDYTKYRVNNSEWIIYSNAFQLPNVEGTYIIEFYSVDNNGNIEDIKIKTAILVNLNVEAYISRGEADVLPYFDVIFSKYKDGGYKLVATNPGQFFYTIEITNEWPIPIDSLTVNINLPSDFVLMGSTPIHIYLDGFDITGSCVIQGDLISISNLPAGGIITIKVHLDYALKGEIFSTLGEFGLRGYTFEPILNVNNQFLIGEYESSTHIAANQKKVTAIAGNIFDADGNPIVGLVVELYDLDGNLIAEATTDENGFFYFIEIDVDEYSVEFCYQTQTYTNIVIALDKELTYIIYNL